MTAKAPTAAPHTAGNTDLYGGIALASRLGVLSASLLSGIVSAFMFEALCRSNKAAPSR